MTDDPTLSAPQRLLMFIEDLLRLIEAQHSEAVRPRFFSFFRRFLPSPALLVAAQLRRFIAAFADIIANLPKVPIARAPVAGPQIPVGEPGSTPDSERDPATEETACAVTPRAPRNPAIAARQAPAMPPDPEPLAADTVARAPRRVRSYFHSLRPAVHPRSAAFPDATGRALTSHLNRSRKPFQRTSPVHA